jgi:hypothetical protein
MQWTTLLLCFSGVNQNGMKNYPKRSLFFGGKRSVSGATQLDAI